MTNDQDIQQIHSWCSIQDWRYTHAVVCVGYEHLRPWEIFAQYRPDVTTFVFIPREGGVDDVSRDFWVRDGNTYFEDPPERVFIADHLVDLRVLLSTQIDPTWRLEIMGDPTLAEKWGPAVTKAVQEGVRFKFSGELTMRNNAEIWMEHGLNILPNFLDTRLMNEYPPMLKGVPGVIVGAGPSLDKNVKQLANIQDRVAIFATNSSLGTLEKAGVQPDVIVVLEAKPTAIEPILDSPLWEKAIMVGGIHSHPDLWKVRARARLPALTPVGSVGSWLLYNWKIAPLFTGGSVSTLCYSVARQLGCSPIVMVGMDCAQGVSGKEDYSKHVKHLEPPSHEQLAFYDTVPAWGGLGFVKASPALSSYREWFESKAKEHVKRGDPIINATEGGARIQDTVEEKLSKIPVGSTVDVVDRILGGDYPGWSLKFLGVRPGRIRKSDVIEGLKKQQRMSEDLVERAKFGHETVTSLMAQVPAFGMSIGNAHLLASYSIGDINERNALPRETHFKAMRQAFLRTVEKSVTLDQMISETIKRLA